MPLLFLIPTPITATFPIFPLTIVFLIEFRNKDNGWKKYEVVVGDRVHETFRANAYMKGFLSNLYLRPSCASCRFVGCRRPGDLTLGDFWGAGNFRKSYDDDKGTSLVLLNSPKARSIFQTLQDKFSPDASYAVIRR